MSIYNSPWLFNSPGKLYNSVDSDQTLFLSGFNATVFGTNEALLAERWLRPAGLDAALLGDPVVTFWLQWCYTAAGELGAIGAPHMGDVRTVNPPWWYSTVFGNAFVGEYLTLSPRGWLGVFGEHSVRSNLQRIQPLSFLPSTIGTQRAYLDDRYIPPPGSVQTLWGYNAVVPMLRTVQQIDGTQLEDQGIGTPLVKPVTIFAGGLLAGVTADRVTVSSSGQVIRTDGFVGSIGRQWTSWADRTLVLRGFEDFNCNEWHHARNAARVLSPTGFDAVSFGTALARNELRYVQHNFPAGPQTFGSSWVSFAVRGIEITEGPPTPLFPLPSAKLWEQYVRPAGYMRAPTDRHEVRATQNRISPDRTVPSTLYGTAGIVNEDREVRPSGLDQGPHGRGRVWRDPEYLNTVGNEQALFGPTDIRDSTRSVRVGPATVGEVPTTHWIRNELPDPPRLQRIFATPIAPLPIGLASVAEYGISVTGINSLAMGTPTVTVNGIRPPGIPPPGYGTGGQFGVASLPGLQMITFESEFNEELLKMGRPRISPSYIFPFPLVDEHLYGPDPSRPRFGSHEIMRADRTVSVTTPPTSVHGATVVSLFERTLPVLGPRLFRAGVPALNGAGDITTQGANTALYGMAIVARPAVTGDQTLAAVGIPADVVGEHEVQNQHRTVVAGAGETNLSGQVWIANQYDPFVMTALRATLWGDNVVMYRDRELTDAGGTEMLDMTPFPGWSRDRMRLTSITSISVPGSAHGVVSAPTVEQQHRTIGVNGIERPQIPNPPPVVRGESTISPAGLEAMVMGNPRMWEPGDDLYPYAEDFLAIGTARLALVVGGSGFDALLMGNIRIAPALAPAGLAAAEHGAHVVVHEGGGRICNSYLALAIAAAGYDAGVIGGHGVAYV